MLGLSVSCYADFDADSINESGLFKLIIFYSCDLVYSKNLVGF